MTDERTVVVYCEGRGARKVKHEPTPLAVYRKRDGDWLPLHSAMFRGESVTLSSSGLQHLAGDRELEPGEFSVPDRRSQYQWKCPTCGMNPAHNDIALVERLLDAKSEDGEVALAEIDWLFREGTKRRPARG